MTGIHLYRYQKMLIYFDDYINNQTIGINIRSVKILRRTNLLAEHRTGQRRCYPPRDRIACSDDPHNAACLDLLSSSSPSGHSLI